MTQKFKRKLKTVFPEKNDSPLDFLVAICIKLTITTFIIFVATNIFTNFLLTPKGIKLENLSQEKNVLVENNRALGQEIARIKSISIIKEITGEAINLNSSASEKIIYISNESIIAGL